MRVRRRLGLGLILVISCALQAASILAQRPSQPFRSRTELVVIDAVVVDERGMPIRGLTASDFVLTTSGQERTIETFQEVQLPDAPAVVLPEDVRLDVADNRTTGSALLIVIVIDDLHLKDVTKEVRRIAGRIVREAGAGASIALLTTSRTTGVELTEDRALLLQTIATFEDAFDGEAPLPRGLQRALNEPNLFSTPGPSGSGPPDPGRFFSDLQAYRTLAEAARMLGNESRLRKVLAWISTGVPRGMAANPFSTGSGEWSRLEASGALHDMQRSNVVTYAIDPGGARTGTLVLAEESGGFVIGRGALDAGIERLMRDLRSFYLLGFSDPTGSSSYQPLSVTVRREGATVRHRRGYRVGDRPHLPANADAIWGPSASVMPARGLPVRLFAGVFPGSSRGKADVEVTCDVSGETDVGQSLRYALLAADLRRRKVVASLTGEISAARSSADGVRRIRSLLQLPPGQYQLRASALAQGSSMGGSAYLTIDVPDFRKAGLVLSSIALGEVAPGSDQSTERVTGRAVPFVPTTRREFPSRSSVRLYARLGSGRPITAATASVSVLEAAGQTVHFSRPAFINDGSIDEVVHLGSVPEGVARLRVTAVRGSETTSREVVLQIK